MTAVLDFPVWHSLNGPQAHLARWHGRAVWIDPDYGPFAAAPADAAADLGAAVLATGEAWIVQPDAIAPPPGCRVIRSAVLVQMIADHPVNTLVHDAEIVRLGEEDAAAMAALAAATQPGPWGPATRLYGPFYGIRRAGRLAAMAGERMRPAVGLAEVSGVCAWPEYRGQGLAGRLIRHVMASLAARGDRPFLHSYASNAAAIRLYESLGFRIRRELVVTVLGAAT